jgi:hypothetical protein
LPFSGFDECLVKLEVAQFDDGRGRCLVCAKTFCTMYMAKRHYLEVHCIDAVKCQLCGAQFNNGRYRDDHLRRTHKITKRMLKDMSAAP